MVKEEPIGETAAVGGEEASGQLLASLPAMYARTRDHDGDPIVDACNDRLCERLGYDRETLLGRSLTAIYSTESADDLLDGGYQRALSNQFTREERALTTSDGDRVYALLRAIPRYADGAVVGTHALFVDITERHRHEETLRRYRSIVESIREGAFIVDDHGTVAAANRSLSGRLEVEPHDLVGDPVGRLIGRVVAPEAERARIRDGVLGVAAGERESFQTRADLDLPGNPVVAMRVSLPVDDAAGAVVVVRDITERAHRERHLKVLHRVMRHNLRNDLNLIIGYASDLREDLAPEETRRVDRLLETANEWLRLSRKAREVERVFEDDTSPVDVTAAARYARRQVTQQHPEANVVLSTPVTGTVAVDTSLGTILSELCENGVTHAEGPNPEIRVTVDPPAETDPWVVVRVADRGPGLPEHERTVLATGEETPLVHGSGFGLWMVHMLVTRAGGELDLADNDPHGTVVTLRLPRG